MDISSLPIFNPDAPPTPGQNIFNPDASSVPLAPPTPSVLGVLGREAVRSALPMAGGLVGGAAGGAALGSVAGPIGTIAGGIAGAFGGSTLADVAQRKLGLVGGPSEVADVTAHPIAAFAGSMLPFAAAFSPAGGLNFVQRAVSGGLMGAIEGGQELAEGQKPDPTKIAIAVGTGAVFNKPNALGRALTGEKLALDRITPPPLLEPSATSTLRQADPAQVSNEQLLQATNVLKPQEASVAPPVAPIPEAPVIPPIAPAVLPREEQVANMRTQLAKEAESPNLGFVKTADVATPAEAYNAIEDELAAGKDQKGLMNLAAKYGIIDGSTGKTRDLDADLAAAKTDEAKAKIQSLIDVRNEAAELRQAPTEEIQNAIQEQGPGEVDVRQPPGNGEGVGVTHGLLEPANEENVPGRNGQTPEAYTKWADWSDASIAEQIRRYQEEMKGLSPTWQTSLQTSINTMQQELARRAPAVPPEVQNAAQNFISGEKQDLSWIGVPDITHTVERGGQNITLGGRDYSRFKFETAPDVEEHPFPDRHEVNDTSPIWHGDVQNTLNNLADRLGMDRPTVLAGNTTEPGLKGISEADRPEITLNQNLAPQEALAVGLHEFGHQVQTQLLDRAPDDTKAAIQAAYDKENPVKTVGEYSPVLSQMSARDVANRPVSADVNSFPEWFAEQATRWLTTDAKPVGVVQQFFKNVADTWRQIYSTLTGGRPPLSKDVVTFMEGHWRSDNAFSGDKVLSSPAAVQAGQEAQARYRLSLPGANDASEKVSDLASTVYDRLTGSRFSEGASKFAKDFNLEAASNARLERSYGAQIPELKQINDAIQEGDRIKAVMQRPTVESLGRVQALAQSSKQGRDRAADLQAAQNAAQQFRVDISKPWEEQASRFADHPFKSQLEQFVKTEGRNIWQRLGQAGGEGQRLWNEAVANGQRYWYGQLVGAYDHVTPVLRDGLHIDGFGGNEIANFVNRNELHGDPAGARDYMQAAFEQRRAGLEEHLTEQSRLLKAAQDAGDGKLAKIIQAHMEPLQNFQDSIIRSKVAHIDQEPYFHNFRTGDYGVSLHLRGDKEGNLDPEAVAAFQKAMDTNGFNDIAVSPMAGSKQVMARFETQTQARSMQKIAQDLKKAGYLDPKESIKSFLVSEGKNNPLQGNAPSFLKAYTEKLADSDAFKPGEDATPDEVSRLAELKAKVLDETRALMMDALPEKSLQKLLQPKTGVQGFRTNTIQAQAHSAEVSSNAIARLATLNKLQTAIAGLRDRARIASEGPDINQNVATQRVVNEMMTRVIGHNFRVGQDGWALLRASTHTLTLGGSPAYVATALSQVGLIGWPELIKNYGPVRAAKAIGAVTTDGLRVAGSIMKDAYKHGFDQAFTPEALKKSGVSNAVQKDLLQFANRGFLETFTGSLGSLARGQISDPLWRAQKMANMSIGGSEMAGRVIIALAARKLYMDAAKAGKPVPTVEGHPATDMFHYVGHVTNESMFQWGNWQMPRIMGPLGRFGAVSKIMGTFHNYSIKLAEKLYGEIHDAIKGETPASRKEAQRFLLAHGAAIVALTGTLGMPAAGWVSGAMTRLSGLWNDEPYDVEAHYRHFLDQTFGKGVGEFLARGGLRSLTGVDMSNISDADIVPLTPLMQDRRKLEDAIPDYLSRAWGAPTSMIGSLLMGSRDLVNGRYIPAAQELLPHAMRNLVGAFQMAQGAHGQPAYIDRNGNELPIPASAGNILATALGFKPAPLAEYQEEKRVAGGAKQDRMYHAQLINERFRRAVNAGDQEGIRGAIADTVQYNQEHPGMFLNPAQNYIQKQQQLAQARGLGLPLGVSMKDLPTMQLLR